MTWQTWHMPSRASAMADPRSFAMRWNISSVSSSRPLATPSRSVPRRPASPSSTRARSSQTAHVRAVPLLPGLERDFLLLDLARHRLRLLHLDQDLVLDAADLALHGLDLVEHGRVFLVGLDLHELALVLRALALEVLEGPFVALARLERFVERLAGPVQVSAIRGQLRFQLGLALRDLGHPGLGPSELALDALEVDQLFEAGVHCGRKF